MKFCISMLMLLAIAGCSSFSKLIKEPKVTLETVGVKDPTMQGATLVFGIKVDNPNAVALTVDEVVYDLEVSGKALTSGKLEQGASVAANSSALIDVPITLKYKDVFGSLLQVLSAEKSPYRIKGEAKFGLIRVPFDKSGEFKIEKPLR